MNVAIREQDRDLVVFISCPSNTCLLSTRALEWKLVTSAVSAPYPYGIAAEIMLSNASIRRW